MLCVVLLSIWCAQVYVVMFTLTCTLTDAYGSRYEGVRFGFIEVVSPSSGRQNPFTITNIRLVVQTKVVNYEGRFSSPLDPMLERVWYTAAWTVRANLLSDSFGSVSNRHPSRYCNTSVSLYRSILPSNDECYRLTMSSNNLPSRQCRFLWQAINHIF